MQQVDLGFLIVSGFPKLYLPANTEKPAFLAPIVVDRQRLKKSVYCKNPFFSLQYNKCAYKKALYFFA
jgi:hypothetical protein